MTLEQIVVVGASLAGLRACETLRQRGFTGRLTLVGAEPEVPYDRPPLSKKLLAGEWEPDRIRLRKADEFDALALDLRLATVAVGLDPDAGTIDVESARGAETLHFDGAIVATGAHPRRLPNQPDVEGVVVLRTLADAMRLRTMLRPGARVTVIGAGFIGLEVAATARQLGCEVVVLEGAAAPLMRGLGADLGRAVASVHSRHGVDIRCGVHVGAIEHEEGRVSAVSLGTGEVVPSDVVVVGVGVAPATEWLAGSGLQLHDGIVCDDTLWTGHGRVVAAGDCARWHNRLFDPDDDAVMRVEHWTNAAEQGAAAADNLLALASDEPRTPYSPVPFFWSDQFESRIQFVGRAHGGDDVSVFAGSPDGPFAALYGWQGRLRGVLGVSMPKLVMPFRRLLADRATWEEALAKAADLAG